MFSGKMLPVIGIAIVSSALAFGLILASNSAQYSSPEKSVAAFVNAESLADLSAMEKPASEALYRNFIGHFGQPKYREVRDIYQEAYDLAEPKWEQYREKARDAATKEHQSIASEIDKLGRDAFAALPEDQRLQMTDDRSRFNDFVFDAGLKALPADIRAKVEDSQAFRDNRDIEDFTNREGFSLLPEEDQSALKSPATLSASITPERIAFLESIGLPLLTAQQRSIIAGIPSSELSDPQAFMFRNGQAPAQAFLKNSALNGVVSMSKCKYSSEDSYGSLFKGSTASCEFSISVRGTQVPATAQLMKQKGVWKIVALYPMITEITEAYPPRPVRHETVALPTVNMAAPVEENTTDTQLSVQRPRIPYASWREVGSSATTAFQMDYIIEGLIKIFPGMTHVLTTALTVMFVILAMVVFCVVMTINFRRLRKQNFLPEWLEDEVQLEEIEVSHWWSRVWLRLTNKRIVQVQLSWFFSRRRIFGIALDDIHSVTWRRHINWLLILIGIYLFSRSNPIAILVLMWGLESRILNIRFNTPLAQMPFPRARASITSFQRQQFSELASFYKKAQLYLAQVRSQKQLPVPRNVQFIPEEDKDFAWGRVVWVFVVIWLVIALGQRTFGDHITLEGFWGGLMLGLPVAAATQSLRGGVWSGVLGSAALVAAKFPGSVGLLIFASSGDGGTPSLWQYFVLVVSAAVIAAIAYGFSRVHSMIAFLAPLVWLLPMAMMRPASLGEMRPYAICFGAIASAAVFSLVAEAVAGEKPPSIVDAESASA